MREQNNKRYQKRTELCQACVSTIDQVLRLHEMLNQMATALNSETVKNTYLQQTIQNTIAHYQSMLINDNILQRSAKIEEEMKRMSMVYENEIRQLKDELQSNKEIINKLTAAGLDLYNKYAKLRYLYNDSLRKSFNKTV